MQIPLDIALTQVVGFMLIVARLSGMFLIAPVFSSKMIPVRIKVMALLVLAATMTPIVMGQQPDVPTDVLGLLISMLLWGCAGHGVLGSEGADPGVLPDLAPPSAKPQGDGTCRGYVASSIRGKLLAEDGTGYAGARAQLCVREGTSDRLTCLRPEEADANGEFQVTVPDDTRCIGAAAMRVLALDLGSKRIGVAVSDGEGTVATPIATLERTRDRARLHREVADLVAEWEAELLLIGLPIALDGSMGPAAQGVLAERDELAAVVGVPVEVHDERLTTRLADRALRERGDLDARARRRLVDQTAAAVILQDWLDHGS